MKKYNFFTFCENLDKIGKDAEEKEILTLYENVKF